MHHSQHLKITFNRQTLHGKHSPSTITLFFLTQWYIHAHVDWQINNDNNVSPLFQLIISGFQFFPVSHNSYERIPNVSTTTKPPRYWHLHKTSYSITTTSLSTVMSDVYALNAFLVCWPNMLWYEHLLSSYYKYIWPLFYVRRVKNLIFCFYGWITWVQCRFVHKAAVYQPVKIREKK